MTAKWCGCMGSWTHCRHFESERYRETDECDARSITLYVARRTLL